MNALPVSFVHFIIQIHFEIYTKCVYVHCKILLYLSSHQFVPLSLSLSLSHNLTLSLPPLSLGLSLKCFLSPFHSTLFQHFSPSVYISFIIPSIMQLSELATHCLHLFLHHVFVCCVLRVFTMASRYLNHTSVCHVTLV